ncbi:endonuclease/exonuclease/phosphatase family protein [Lichenicola sp.]|uniref:endonuclease/exonuclease/phosphatase family protein n=1 Tax=Lichenicola sp. TaxID=2804529 RepID=UPI003B00CAC4
MITSIRNSTAPGRPAGSGDTSPAMRLRILSWNLLRTRGATTADIGRLIELHNPDLVMMQEATAAIDGLPGLIGGHYAREPMLRRSHGPAVWSRQRFDAVAETLPIAGRLDLPVPIFRAVSPRLALVVRLGWLRAATVHLDHGQRANRRQLRHLLASHPQLDMVIGDFNALGPTGLPGFRDVGPRVATHRAHGLLPLRLDRCLVRGLQCTASSALAYGRSDHRPILLDLAAVA